MQNRDFQDCQVNWDLPKLENRLLALDSSAEPSLTLGSSAEPRTVWEVRSDSLCQYFQNLAEVFVKDQESLTMKTLSREPSLDLESSAEPRSSRTWQRYVSCRSFMRKTESRL